MSSRKSRRDRADRGRVGETASWWASRPPISRAPLSRSAILTAARDKPTRRPLSPKPLVRRRRFQRATRRNDNARWPYTQTVGRRVEGPDRVLPQARAAPGRVRRRQNHPAVLVAAAVCDRRRRGAAAHDGAADGRADGARPSAHQVPGGAARVPRGEGAAARQDARHRRQGARRVQAVHGGVRPRRLPPRDAAEGVAAGGAGAQAPRGRALRVRAPPAVRQAPPPVRAAAPRAHRGDGGPLRRPAPAAARRRALRAARRLDALGRADPAGPRGADPVGRGARLGRLRLGARAAGVDRGDLRRPVAADAGGGGGDARGRPRREGLRREVGGQGARRLAPPAGGGDGGGGGAAARPGTGEGAAVGRP